MENNNIFRSINANLSREDILMLSPLQLAYVGDAVYELLVRTYLLNIGLNVNELHKLTTKYVKAKAQADIVHFIEETLSDEERSYIKKGRNAKTHSSPKNADILDYKYATGFECLFGYLYLTGQDLRIREIFDQIIVLDIN
jgi:ribonuclease-3 family protein